MLFSAKLLQIDKLNFIQHRLKDLVLFYHVTFCIKIYLDETENHTLCALCNVTPSTFHHFDSPEPSTNQWDCSYAKKTMSEGWFIRCLVTEAENTWSNSVCIVPHSCPKIIGYRRKCSNCRIILSKYGKSLLFSLEAVRDCSNVYIWAGTHNETRRPCKHCRYCIILFPCLHQ